MNNKEYFGVVIDKTIKKNFLKKVMEKYYHGKIREVLEILLNNYNCGKCENCINSKMNNKI